MKTLYNRPGINDPGASNFFQQVRISKNQSVVNPSGHLNSSCVVPGLNPQIDVSADTPGKGYPNEDEEDFFCSRDPGVIRGDERNHG
jgi:hypothetical protein